MAPMRGAAFAIGLLALITPALSATSAASFCSKCGKTYDPVCGLDGQTYANDCVRQCAAVPLKNKGKCAVGCYPDGEGDCDNPLYDWDSKEPICVNGLTWTNVAEARCAGAPPKLVPECYQKGVCKYNVRNGVAQSFYVTPPGRGGSVAAAANDKKPLPHTGARYSYSEALTKALIFYDSMISGPIEKAGHQRLTWRKDSCLTCKGKYGENLSGGFYEAGGSYLKFPLINAYMTVMLAWSGIESTPAYQKSNTLGDLKWKVKWGADYLLQCYVKDYVYAGLNGNDTLDFDYFGPPELYQNYVKSRPTGYITKQNRGSEVLADSAAALAASSILLKEDKVWAANAVAKAKSLYAWAVQYPGSYMDNKDPVMKIHANLYESNGYIDELSWAAYWLYRATNEPKYLVASKSWYAKAGKFNTQDNSFELADWRPALAVLLANSAEPVYRSDANAYFNSYLTQAQPHTPRGLAYPYHWGGGRTAGNVAFLAMTYAQNTKSIAPDYRNRLRNYAEFQVNYLLGDSGRSWIVGFGSKYPNYVWHKPSYNSILDWDPEMAKKVYLGPNPGPWASALSQPAGAYVEKGKFDFEGSLTPQRRIAYGTLFTPLFTDNLIASRKDYTYAEPTIEYASGLTGALAYFTGWYGQGPYTGKMIDVLKTAATDPPTKSPSPKPTSPKPKPASPKPTSPKPSSPKPVAG